MLECADNMGGGVLADILREEGGGGGYSLHSLEEISVIPLCIQETILVQIEQKQLRVTLHHTIRPIVEYRPVLPTLA